MVKMHLYIGYEKRQNIRKKHLNIAFRKFQYFKKYLCLKSCYRLMIEFDYDLMTQNSKIFSLILEIIDKKR